MSQTVLFAGFYVTLGLICVGSIVFTLLSPLAKRPWQKPQYKAFILTVVSTACCFVVAILISRLQNMPVVKSSLFGENLAPTFFFGFFAFVSCINVVRFRRALKE